MKRDKRSPLAKGISEDELQPTIELLTRLVGHYFGPRVAHYRIVNEIARLKSLQGEKGDKL